MSITGQEGAEGAFPPLAAAPLRGIVLLETPLD